jgi:hypothetical protein
MRRTRQVDVRYAPGRGVLLARSGRCLLLGVSAETVPGLVDQLWQDLGEPDAAEAALTTVRRHAPGISVAYLDTATGHSVTEQPAAVERVDDAWRLGAGELDSGPVRLPLVEGVVAAAVLEVADPQPRRGHPHTGPLIEGIPPDILASTRPESPPEQGSTDQHTVGDQADRAGFRVRADHDHEDDRTRPRTTATASRPPAGGSGHLEQSTADTVLAVRCPAGHLSDPVAATCRSCGASVAVQEPQRVLRPPLGVLRLADDTEVLLDRPVVLGRRPTPSGPGDWPHLVNLSGDSTYLSRNHLRIDLDGWHVLARDLGSRGGTTLFAPGRDPERIRAHEPHLLEPGTVVDLAGAYQVTLLTTTPAAPRSAPPDVEATT